jgi:hypothetical protein
MTKIAENCDHSIDPISLNEIKIGGIIIHPCFVDVIEVAIYTHAQTCTWDRCYDFLNIFAKKFGEKIGVFDSKQS